MQYGMIRKTISFNLNDPEERAMFELISAPNVNFSKVVKQFLAAQLRTRVTNTQPVSHAHTAHTQQKSDLR